MKQIKIISFIIVVLFINLFFISLNISKNNQNLNNLKDNINIQKYITQDISKEVMYLYKNKHINYNHLKDSLKIFKLNQENIKSKKILNQSKEFIHLVDEFENQMKHPTPYSTIIIDKLVQQIYFVTFHILQSCDNLLAKKSKIYKKSIESQNDIRNIIFISLFISFGYLIFYIIKYKSNFEILIDKIENSINSIDQIEQTVEKYLQETPNVKDEDIIIESLEELMNSSIKLKQLQTKLKNS